MLIWEECVGGMAQRLHVNDAALGDVTTKSKREESASHMALRRNYAATRDVPIKHRREEYAGRMAQR